MKKAWALTKIYIESYYGVMSLINDIKLNKKMALKKIGFLILILFSFSGFLPMVVFYNINMYNVLKPINQQGLMLTNMMISITIFMLAFGFLGIVTTYFLGPERTLLLSMPFKPWQVFISRFFINYLSELLLAFAFMLPTIIIYGTNEGMGILYYIISILIILFIPIIPMVICYFLLTPVMRFAGFLKNKDTMMKLSIVFVLIIVAFMQYFSKFMMDVEKNPNLILKSMMSPNGMVNVVGRIYYPSIIATKAILSSSSFMGWLNLILFFVISIAAVLLLMNTMSGLYYNSNIGSDEVKKSKKHYDNNKLKEKFKKRGIIISMLSRERKLMNREPVHFLNGPMAMIIMPLILAVVFLIQGESMAELTKLIGNLGEGVYYKTLFVIAFGLFTSMSGNPSSSAVSRDGKSLMFIKSLPISPKDYISAKLLHGLELSMFGNAISCILGEVIFKLPVFNIVMAFIISNLILLPIIIIGLIIDFKWPKLSWDDPVKAMKQNLNVVVVVLFGMFVIIPVIGIVVYKFLRNPVYGYFTLILAPLLISAVLYRWLITYSNKRYYRIEI